MNKVEKEQIVQEIKKKVSESKAVFLFEYHGLNVQDMTTLRTDLRRKNGELKVFKNTLVKKALQETPLKDLLEKDFKGPIACAFGYSDEVTVAKTLVDFKKEDASLNIKSAVLGSQKISLNEIKQLSKLPSKEIMLGQLLATVAAPVRGLVTVLSAVTRDFVYVLKAIEDKKGKA
ncbi:MAG: 50S ribosomal protein L10 [Deltaproteobacteria bacterium GWA2_38_16]|nr:MAG: 50S ribosomal protein L10 [Deltaproteobacteria bacterium GWA2_38_16]OGQ01908.1 MAG: 50S ribosomal protein L10 [Deltaproteobacteria bacterium RIFCSPHIGHO2_02_FULL_38_15]OGQ30304.1 MAG: 50S ribosomal protein L10 [Deltaproteobacteria bacterium RIFCSPLOWO2_01_FULL_38_9]OGQ61189.1 MAG: 50S ribosomal protein L10 [Deltaproteobacteria bacterium RIFCSPLOWO2_12_FULL_38_8]